MMDMVIKSMKKTARTLAVAMFSLNLVAEINITTLSDWDINDFDEHTLLIAKTSDTSQAWKSILAFHVARPHCVGSHPIIMVRSKSNSYSNGDIVLAEMKVDKDKPRFLKLEQQFGFEDDGEYVHWFKLLKFPSFENSDRVEIKFKSQTPFKSFAVNTTGIRKAQYVAEQVCNSPVPIQTVRGFEKV
jgi:hypothetical protein